MHNKITHCICAVEPVLNLIVIVFWFELVGVILRLLKAKSFSVVGKLLVLSAA